MNFRIHKYEFVFNALVHYFTLKVHPHPVAYLILLSDSTLLENVSNFCLTDNDFEIVLPESYDDFIFLSVTTFLKPILHHEK